MRNEIDEKVSFSSELAFLLHKLFVKVFFPVLLSNLPYKLLCFPPKKGINRRSDSAFFAIFMCTDCI